MINPSKALLTVYGKFPVPGKYFVEICDQCGDCARACPQDAIQLKGSTYRIDRKKCDACLGGKTHFCTKSPVTGGYGDSNMGGHFGITMKYAGYDVTLIKGRAEQPSYIFIDDDTIEVRTAEGYWGKGSTAVEEAMKQELGEDFQILTIGEAGENRVSFALECYEKGYISEKEMGMDVKWGDLASIVHILEMIAKRKGIGDVLAMGVRGAAEKIGKNLAFKPDVQQTGDTGFWTQIRLSAGTVYTRTHSQRPQQRSFHEHGSDRGDAGYLIMPPGAGMKTEFPHPKPLKSTN